MTRNHVRVTTGFPLIVKHQLALREMVSQGDFWIVRNQHLLTPDHFPHDASIGEVRVDASLIAFSEVGLISTGDVLAVLQRHRLRPAGIAEMLAFAVTHPDQQRQRAIVGLGAHWTAHVLVIDEHGFIFNEGEVDQRCLRVLSIEGSWRTAETSFLVIPIGQVPQLDAEWKRVRREAYM